MEFSVNKNKLASLGKRFNLMVCLTFGLLISNIALGGLSWYAMLHQKTTVTPFFGGNGFVVSGSSVDANYISMMSENFVYAKLTVSPKTIAHQNEILLKYAAPKQYAYFRETLKKERRIVESKEISSHIQITDIKSNPAMLESIVTGELSRTVGTRELKKEHVQYKLNFNYQLGHLSITRFTLIKGNENV